MKTPVLEVEERLVYSATATRRPPGGGRSVGGRLFVMNTRLVHVAGRADRLFGAEDFECGLEQVVDVKDEGRFKSLVRAIGVTVAVRLSSGEAERFVVWNAQGLIEAIRGPGLEGERLIP